MLNYLAFDAYVECALWASVGGDTGEPLDLDYSTEDFAPETLVSMREDLQSFLGMPQVSGWSEVLDDAQMGRDFWLTRNRHGAGFWDRGIGELGERLTEAAHTFGSSDLYVGDDGLLYVQ
jgi:hypothetical protein